MTGNHTIAPQAARPKTGQAVRPRLIDVAQQARRDAGRRLAGARRSARYTQMQRLRAYQSPCHHDPGLRLG